MPTPSELNKQGVELWTKKDYQGAKLHYLAALELDPNFTSALLNMGVVLSSENKLQASVVCFQKLVGLNPNDYGAWNNLGNLLTRLERFPEAEHALGQAMNLDPENSGTWHNKALLCYRMAQYEESLNYINKIKALGNTNRIILSDEAHVLLAMGEDLPHALEVYENRWEQLIHLPPWNFEIPEWQGEDLADCHILVHSEQGYGDTIMTARFIKNLITKYNCWVTLCLPRELCQLFDHQDWHRVQVLPMDDLNKHEALKFNYHSPLYSMMRWLKITWNDVSPKPYLVPPDLSVLPILHNKFNIGICWASGRRGMDLDYRYRHAPLTHWLKLSEFPKVQLYSLQKGPEVQDIPQLGAEILIKDFSCYLENWADTAAFINQLDLVISVDTAVAHLSAALGKPTWMLSQSANCWRWINIEQHSGLPWYETMTIFRQNDPDNWKCLLDSCHAKLRSLA